MDNTTVLHDGCSSHCRMSEEQRLVNNEPRVEKRGAKTLGPLFSCGVDLDRHKRINIVLPFASLPLQEAKLERWTHAPTVSLLSFLLPLLPFFLLLPEFDTPVFSALCLRTQCLLQGKMFKGRETQPSNSSDHTTHILSSPFPSTSSVSPNAVVYPSIPPLD